MEDSKAIILGLINEYDKTILDEWEKDTGIDRDEILDMLCKIYNRIDKSTLKEQGLWESIKWINQIDIKNKVRGSSVTYIGIIESAGLPVDWVTSKRVYALDIYFSDRMRALKEKLVRIDKDPETQKEVPVAVYPPLNRFGKPSGFAGRALPEVGYIRKADGFAIPKSELTKTSGKPIDWNKMKPFTLNFQPEHADPKSDKYVRFNRDEVIEFTASGKVIDVDLGAGKKKSIYVLNTSTKTERLFQKSDLLELSLEDKITYFGRPLFLLSQLKVVHEMGYTTKETKQYGSTLFVTEATVAEITLGNEKDKTSHLIMLEHDSLTTKQRSVTCWLPYDIPVGHIGKYSKVFIIGTTARRYLNNEWEYPQIQGTGILAIKVVTPQVDDEGEGVKKVISDDRFSPEDIMLQDVKSVLTQANTSVPLPVEQQNPVPVPPVQVLDLNSLVEPVQESQNTPQVVGRRGKKQEEPVEKKW